MATSEDTDGQPTTTNDENVDDNVECKVDGDVNGNDVGGGGGRLIIDIDESASSPARHDDDDAVNEKRIESSTSEDWMETSTSDVDDGKRRRRRSSSRSRSRNRSRSPARKRIRRRSNSSSSRGTFDGYDVEENCHFSCRRCRRRFRTIRELSEHEIRAHDADVLCMHCSKKSVSVTKLAAHMLFRHPDKDVTCRYCNQFFGGLAEDVRESTWTDFRAHIYNEVLKEKMYMHSTKSSGVPSYTKTLRGVGRCPHGAPVKCKNFPMCPGAKCIYAHGQCRYDLTCNKPTCPFDHSSRPRTCMACVKDLKILEPPKVSRMMFRTENPSFAFNYNCNSPQEWARRSQAMGFFNFPPPSLMHPQQFQFQHPPPFHFQHQHQHQFNQFHQKPYGFGFGPKAAGGQKNQFERRRR